MNKVKMVIKKLEFGKSQVTFEVEGDIWKWHKKNHRKKETLANNILEYVRSNEVHEFSYDMYLDKFTRKYKDIVDEIVAL